MKICVGHHPVYSSGFSNHEDNDFMRTYLSPILNANNVTAYFSGHEHNLEYHRPTSNTKTHYFISGAGSKIAGYFTNPEDGFEFYFDDSSGFLSASVIVYENSSSKLIVSFLNVNGTVVHTLDTSISTA